MEDFSRRRLTVIAAVTDTCNLACVYCRIPAKNSKVMDEVTLENMLVNQSLYNRKWGSSPVIWHGNEPLAAGVDFYRKAVEIEQGLDHVFHNSIQTNGLLLDDEYLEFFKEHKFKVGISLDGIAVTHNMNRPYPNGRPTFDRVFESFLRAREAGVGGGVVCVVNKNNVDKLEEIYHFFKTNHINAKLNPQLPDGRGRENIDLLLSPREYGEAMIRLFDIWYNDTTPPAIDLDPFSHYIQNLPQVREMLKELSTNQQLLEYMGNLFPGLSITSVRLPLSRGCEMSNDCFLSHRGVDVNGDIYPCPRCFGNDLFLLGNVNRDSFPDNSEKYASHPLYKRATEGMEQCNSCAYLSLCGAGCPQVSYLYSGDVNRPDPFCEAQKMLIQHIKEVIFEGGA